MTIDEDIKRLEESNVKYKGAYKHWQLKTLKGDMMMFHLRKERLPLGTYDKTIQDQEN